MAEARHSKSLASSTSAARKSRRTEIDRSRAVSLARKAAIANSRAAEASEWMDDTLPAASRTSFDKHHKHSGSRMSHGIKTKSSKFQVVNPQTELYSSRHHRQKIHKHHHRDHKPVYEPYLDEMEPPGPINHETFYPTTKHPSDEYLWSHVERHPIKDSQQYNTFYPPGLSDTDIPGGPAFARRQYSLENLIKVPTLVSTYMGLPTNDIPEYLLDSMTAGGKRRVLAGIARLNAEEDAVAAKRNLKLFGTDFSNLDTYKVQTKDDLKYEQKVKSATPKKSEVKKPEEPKKEPPKPPTPPPKKKSKTPPKKKSKTPPKKLKPKTPPKKPKPKTPPPKKPKPKTPVKPKPKTPLKKKPPARPPTAKKVLAAVKRSPIPRPTTAKKPRATPSGFPVLPNITLPFPLPPRRKSRRKSPKYYYSSSESEEDEGLCFEFRPESPCAAEISITIEPADDECPLEYAINNGIMPIICSMSPPCYGMPQNGSSFGNSYNVFCPKPNYY